MIRIGTRKSKLALIQTELVKTQILKYFPNEKIEIVHVVTHGDKVLDKPLGEIGGKGVFTKEIEEKLLDKTIDIAVHSAKDVPMELADGLCLGAVLLRDDNRDVILKRKETKKIGAGSIIGTSSLRREIQIKQISPDVTIKSLRGNVGTRIDKLKSGEYDAIILAAAGLKPIFAVYSSFLQRAYDQILHDVCIQNLPVVFAIDRAGLVGSDGDTHQGIFDISYLSAIPNMTIMAPKNKWELSDMIKYAVDFPTPIAVRYPRGEAYDGLKEYRQPISVGKSEWIYRESEIALVALGSMVKTAEKVHAALREEGIPASLINSRFAKPLDTQMLMEAASKHTLVVTMEENVINGGFGEHITRFYNEQGIYVNVLNIAIPDEYVEHGNVDILYHEVGIDADTILKRIKEVYHPL